MQFKKITAAAAIGAMLSVSAAAFAVDVEVKQKQSVGEYTADAMITTKVKAAILAEKNLSTLDISVKTHDGVVQLTGSVATAAQADHAARVARGVQDVKKVENKLKVDPAKR